MNDSRANVMKTGYGLDIFISGIGGLGLLGLTRKTAILLSSRYKKVVTGESRGIAQRRGSVSGVIRAGDDVRTAKLLTDKANIIAALESFEIIRKPKLIKPGTICIISDLAIQNFGGSQHKIKYPSMNELVTLVESMGGKPVVIPFKDYAKRHELRNVHISSVMYGVMASLLGFSQESMLDERITGKPDAKNLSAMKYGYDLSLTVESTLNELPSPQGDVALSGQTAA